ncbi:MAG: hypothetical protein ACLFN8_02530 [Candidatus Woesearchaeota archaeon]
MSLIIFNKKGATFFTIDTLIAGLIILVTIILVLSIFTSKPVVEDTYHDLNNYVTFLASTTMRDVRDNYQFAYNAAFEDDLDLFVYQKVYKLYLEGDVSEAHSLIANLTGFVVPHHLGFSYTVGDFEVFSRNEDLLDFAKTSLTSRLLTFYFNESDFTTSLTTTNITIWT